MRMLWAKILVSVLLVQAVLAQDAEDQTAARRIRPRIRRPRPRLVEVDDPEGELQGSPVPILLTEESAQIIASPQRSSGNAALDALIATAQKEEIVAEPIVEAALPQEEPAIVDVQDIPTDAQEPITPLRAQRPAAGSRRRPGVPRRRRPRPERPSAADSDESAGEPSAPRGRPRGGQQDEPVGTLERYSHKNDDGSFTFGYVGADGSFREETRGVDCITRGKYGYIDPDGVKREYTYTSGLPCEIGEDGVQLQNLDGADNVEDTVDPRERFRQTQNVQLTDDEIPAERLRQRVRAQTNQRRAQAQNDARDAANDAARAPEQQAAAPVVQQQNTNTFSNFGANSNRAQLPQQRRPVPNRNVIGGAALENLLNIADESQPQAAAPAPVPQRIPQRIATAAPPAIPQRVPAGSFDFDSELEGFTLNRPSLTFEQNRANEEAGKPSTSFQSSLVFDQQTGTFQTQLQQNIPGSDSLNLQNNAAPFNVQQTTAAPATTFGAQNIDFTLTRTQAASPTPTVGTPAPRRPTPTAAASGILPAGTFKLDFEPLNIPAGAVPVPQAARPTTVNLPTPTQQAAVRQPAPTPARAPVPTQGPVPNTFFVFQPFNQGGQPAPSPRPASDPFNTPLNQNAFRIIGGAPAGAPGAPRPAAPQQFAPQTFQPQQIGAPVIQRLPVPQAAAPARPAAPTGAAPAGPAQPPAFNPQASFQSSPQLQFGFQPVSQQQQQAGQPQPPRRAQPFTAFQSGPPPQLQAFSNQQQFIQQQQQQPQQLGGGAPVRFAPAQLGVPPQLQQQQPSAEQPRFAPRPNQARPATFFPQGGAPTFSVFNPTQLRGA